MTTITLKQAVDIKNIISGKVNELSAERYRGATITYYEDKEPVDNGYRPFDEVDRDLTQARNDLRKLSNLIAVANATNTIDVDGEELNIIEAIEYAKQIRNDINELKNFSNAKKKDVKVQNTVGGLASVVTETTYDPDVLKLRIKQLSSKVFNLSSLIDQANNAIRINFENVHLYV